jgi:hypothetical protein
MRVECPVVRSEYKGNPGYPYRTHSALKITEVPTLFRWGDGAPDTVVKYPALARSEDILEALS